MKKIRNIIIYIVCGCLVMFFGGMLVLAKDPKVSDEYEMYYLTHELKKWPAEGGLSKNVDAVEYMTDQGVVIYNTSLRVGEGWNIRIGIAEASEGLFNLTSESMLYYKFDEDMEGATFAINISRYAIPGIDANDDNNNQSSADYLEASYTTEKREESTEEAVKTSVYIRERGTDEETYIGEFDDVGKYEFALPRLQRDTVYEVVFKSKGYTFRLKTTEIKSNRE